MGPEDTEEVQKGNPLEGTPGGFLKSHPPSALVVQFHLDRQGQELVPQARRGCVAAGREQVDLETLPSSLDPRALLDDEALLRHGADVLEDVSPLNAHLGSNPRLRDSRCRVAAFSRSVFHEVEEDPLADGQPELRPNPGQ